MILIISFSNDVSTQHVCQWLQFLKKKYLVITEKSLLNGVTITNHNFFFNKNGIKYNIKDFNNIWYRRGRFIYKKVVQNQYDFLNTNINKEFEKINDFVLNNLGINELYYNDINKLKILKIASEIKFNVPKYIITDSKKNLTTFFNEKKIITKPIDEVVFYSDEKYNYSSFTEEIDILKLDENFEYSFFQEKIEKKYEIRTFIFENDISSIAIFSQKNKDTEIDYRRYNYSKPNRNVNYKLDNETEKKILLFMRKLNLFTGSIDFIVDKNNILYFLEINPIGQFGNVSFHGNYNCEFKIATKL
jgi:ATP-GRASP peptide maturase of grasp-with-spasm system